MNKITLVGNLARDPELTTTANGVSVCRFSLAVNRDYENADGNRDCDFFNVTVWRGRAESCAKYLQKGNKVAVAGSLEIHNYENQEGEKRISVDVVATEVEFLTPKGSGARDIPGSDKYDKPEESTPPTDNKSEKGKKKVEEITENQLPF